MYNETKTPAAKSGLRISVANEQDSTVVLSKFF